MNTRRELLQGGAIVATYGGLLSLSGCTGVDLEPSDDLKTAEETTDGTDVSPNEADTESEDTEDGDEQEETDLDIGEVRFLESKPDGYGEYTDLDEPVYGADEEIWIYIEPSGVGIEDPDEKDPYYDVQVVFEFTDPNGESLRPLRQDLGETIADESALDQFYIWANYSIRRPTVGEYTVDIELVDQTTRQRVTETATFAIEDETLRLMNEFEKTVRDLTDAEINQVSLREGTVSVTYDSPYSRDEIELYDDVAEIAVAYADAIDQGLEADTLRTKGTDSDGKEIRIIVETERARKYIEGELFRDEYTQQIYNHWHVEVFRAVIEEETDITFERLAIRDDTFAVTYESTYETDEDAFDEEMGSIAGAFAGVIDNGLVVDRMRVSGTAADGTEFSYRAEADRAKALNEDEISMDEYLEHVFKTFRKRDNS